MRLLAATEKNSCFKEIVCEQGTDTSKKDGLLPVSISTYKYDSAQGEGKISKMVTLKRGDYDLLVVARNNFNLQVFKISDIGEPYYSYNLLKSVVLHYSAENDDEAENEEEEYPEDTKFVSLNVHDEFLYAATESGEVFFIHLQDIVDSFTKEDLQRVEAEINELVEKITATKAAAESEKPNEDKPAEETKPTPKLINKAVPFVSFGSGSDLIAKYIKLKTKESLAAFIDSKANFGIFAYGGKEQDLKVISITNELATYKDHKLSKDQSEKPKVKIDESESIVFEAKNVKNNRLDLRVPVWVSNILFINEDKNVIESLSTITKKDFDEKNIKLDILVTTNYGELRIYDSSHGRKPVANQVVFQNKNSISLTQKPRIMTLTKSTSPDEVILSDNHTSTVKYNYAKSQHLGKYTGMQGATVASHALIGDAETDESILVTGSLDKYLRAYDIESRDQVAKVFLKSRINAVHYLPELGLSASDEETSGKKRSRDGGGDEGESSDDDEDIWNQLEENKTVDEEDCAKAKKSKKKKSA